MTDPHAPPPRPSGTISSIIFGISLALNLLILVVVLFACAGVVSAFRSSGQESSSALTERYHSGKKSASDKVAVVAIDGVILEGLNGFAEKQIEQAAQDKHVKAVVVQRTTITGSIGVYASFPDVTGLSEKIGVDMTYIKRGAVKASGNPFRKLSPEEYAVWDEMVGQSYDQFLAVVKQGRGDKLKKDLTANIVDQDRTVTFNEKDPKTQEATTERKKIHYTRQLADGGIWTPDQALQYGLIDKIGYLEDAVKEAHDLANLGDDWKAITYEPPSLLSRLLAGSGAQESSKGFDAAKLADAATPRLWYLMPQAEMSGILKAAGR
jgi:ClpP class serine protease